MGRILDSFGKNSSPLFDDRGEWLSNDAIGPTEKLASDGIGIGDTPARVIDNDAIRNGLHNVFLLVCVAAGDTRPLLNAPEEADILNG